MNNSPFPPNIPKVGDVIGVRAYTEADFVVRHYKDFYEEGVVHSRFWCQDYEGNPYIQICFGGDKITNPLRYNPEKDMWLTEFDGETDQIVVVTTLLN